MTTTSNLNRRQWSSRHRQQGMTTLGLIILIMFIGLFVYAGIRLLPAYLENLKISGAFESLTAEYDGKSVSRRDIQRAMEKRFDVDSVNVITYRDVTVTKTTEGHDINVQYVHTVPFLANVSFSVEFNNQTFIAR